jgi:uncharacterized repeat protein (TIGR03803 family)
MLATALLAVFALTLLTTHAIEAQTFSVIHNFSGGGDGKYPDAGVTVGPSGVLYGTASAGGTQGLELGVVFKLTHIGSSWVFGPLYEFAGHGDGADPYGGVVISPNGALYGTAFSGNYGNVFELTPPATFCRSILCYWNETILYNFMGTPDGNGPLYEDLAFDRAGDIYGTTYYGGTNNVGTVFELTPSGGGYTESILHSFGSGTDGAYPESGVVLDAAGNVYGTTAAGGTGTECNGGGCGTVYQLMPSNGGWAENVLVNFDGADGENPNGLIMDAFGSLYGTTSGGGQNGGGVVFKLARSGGGWSYAPLYSFSSGSCYPLSGVTMDAAGDLFGVCQIGGAHNDGWVYELTSCSQRCIANDLHDFSGSDGANPWGGPVLDANGNLYGTTYYGGTGTCYDEGCGVVWEIAGVGAQHKN